MAEIVAATGAKVTGAAADAHRLPPLDHAVAPGDSFALCGEEAQVIDVSGHTVGHVAFHLPGPALAFTADSLMAIGCGRQGALATRLLRARGIANRMGFFLHIPWPDVAAQPPPAGGGAVRL